jgi:hypothetical protein
MTNHACGLPEALIATWMAIRVAAATADALSSFFLLHWSTASETMSFATTRD